MDYQKKIIRKQCPECLSYHRVLFKCRECSKILCVECMIDGLCFNHFMEKNHKKEIDIYFDDKRLMGVLFNEI